MAARTTFSDVAVSLPSKIQGSEAEEEWQEVDWVTWDTGELSADADSFMLVFHPSAGKTGPSSVKAKPLGNLIRASAVGADDDSARTLVVTTSDSLHRLYRLTFSSSRCVAGFKELAADAEAAHAATSSNGAEVEHISASQQQLVCALQEKYASRWPLIFGAVELYGRDPSGNAAEAGSEVLLGAGAFVILDPEESVRTAGQYLLEFFSEDEGASKPVKSFPIGPRMSLKRTPLDAQDPDGPAALFQLTVPTEPQPHSIAFDDAASAAAFSRDFRVRSRLMDVALKFKSGERTANEARDELKEFKSRTLGARLRGFCCLLLVLLVVSAAARFGFLYSQAPDKDCVLIWQQVQKDISHAAHFGHSFATSVGSKVCEVAVGTVSQSSLQKCLEVGGVSAVRECVEKLLEHRGL